MTITQDEALEAMLRHHRSLDEHVGIRVDALVGAVDHGTAYEPAVATLVTYLAEEVLTHVEAEELTIYDVARARADLVETVNEMIAEDRLLASAVEALATARTGPAAKKHAQKIGAIVTTHVNKDDLLLRVLAEDDAVDLAQLLVQIDRLTEAVQDASNVDVDAGPRDGGVIAPLGGGE